MTNCYRAGLQTLGGQRYRKLPRELRALLHVHAKRDEYVGAVAEDVCRVLGFTGRDDLASRLDDALASIIEGEVRGGGGRYRWGVSDLGLGVRGACLRPRDQPGGYLRLDTNICVRFSTL